MNNFNTIKRIHDLLIKEGLIYIPGEFDSYYYYPDNKYGFTLNKTVFNTVMDGYDSDIENGGYANAGYDSKDEWDTKELIAFGPDIDSFTLLTIMPDGAMKLA